MTLTTLPIGFHFKPKPEEIVGYYLPRKITNQPLKSFSSSFIKDDDVYGADDPAVLTLRHRPSNREGHFYFYSSSRLQTLSGKRCNRAVANGWWRSKQNVKDILVYDAARRRKVKIGEHRNLGYVVKMPDGSEGKTEWLMEEFCGLDEGGKFLGVNGDRVAVICRIYKSPRTGTSSSNLEDGLKPQVPSNSNSGVVLDDVVACGGGGGGERGWEEEGIKKKRIRR